MKAELGATRFQKVKITLGTTRFPSLYMFIVQMDWNSLSTFVFDFTERCSVWSFSRKSDNQYLAFSHDNVQKLLVKACVVHE